MLRVMGTRGVGGSLLCPWLYGLRVVPHRLWRAVRDYEPGHLHVLRARVKLTPPVSRDAVTETGVALSTVVASW